MRVLIPFLFIVILTSCSKEEDVNSIEPACIIAGDRSGMIVTVIEDTVKANTSLELDLDGDWVNDVSFSHEASGLGPQYYLRFRLSSLHDKILIAQRPSRDSIYFTERMSSEFCDVGGVQGVISLIELKYTCYPYWSYSELFEVSDPHLETRPIKLGSSLCKSDIFISGELELEKIEPGELEHVHSSHGPTWDSTIYRSTSYQYCDFFPGGNYFIGFKTYQETGEKLGWIKVELNRNFIYETAIQK